MSKKFSLDNIDRKKIGKGALIALWGALFTYIEGLILATDFGQRSPIVMMVNSIVVNAVQKWIVDNGGKPLPTPEPMKDTEVFIDINKPTDG